MKIAGTIGYPHTRYGRGRSGRRRRRRNTPIAPTMCSSSDANMTYVNSCSYEPDSASTDDQTTSAMMAMCGVRKRSWMRAHAFRKTPSRAIAKSSRAPARIAASSHPNVDTMTVSATRVAPAGPTIAVAALADPQGPLQVAHRQRVEVCNVDDEVDEREQADTVDQRARQIALRLLHLAGDPRHAVPCVVRPQHGDHRHAERGKRMRDGWHDRRPLRRRPRREQRHHRQRGQARDLRDRQHHVGRISNANADVVDGAEKTMAATAT